MPAQAQRLRSACAVHARHLRGACAPGPMVRSIDAGDATADVATYTGVAAYVGVTSVAAHPNATAAQSTPGFPHSPFHPNLTPQ